MQNNIFFIFALINGRAYINLYYLKYDDGLLVVANELEQSIPYFIRQVCCPNLVAYKVAGLLYIFTSSISYFFFFSFYCHYSYIVVLYLACT